MALTQVSTGGVKDGTILNADINSSASIAGSKISPIFTSATEVQNSTFKITDSNPEILLAVPSGGLDSRIINDGSGNLIIGHGVNSDTPTERLRLDSSGNVRIGSGAPATFGSGTTVLETHNANSFTANLVTSGTHQLQMIASQTHGATSIGTRSNHNLNLCANDSTKVTITTAGDCGIGTTSPGQKLDISGNINTTGELRFDSATRRIFYRSGNNDMIFEAAANFFYMQDIGNTAHKWFTNSGDVRLLIQADGNVAIGGTSSSAPLFFGKSVYGEQDSENFYRIKFNDVGGIGNDVGIGQPDSSSIGFNTVSNGSIRFYQGTDGEVARIHDNTYFGVGTTTPHRPIHQHVPNSGANYHQFTNTATGKLAGDGGVVGIDANEALILWNQENTPLRFGTNDLERVRITSDGKIGIGGNTSPADLVHIGSTSTSYYRFRDLNSETIGCIIRKNITATAYTALDFRNGNGPSGTLTVSTGSVSLSNASDYRLKENETVISDGITKIKQLIPRRFNFKKDPTNTLDGFFAHEVSGVVPEAVIGEKDASIDEDGNGYQQLDPTKLIPILTAGLKEAIVKIETLETKVAALEAK